MTLKHTSRAVAATILVVTLLSAAQAGRTPSGDLAALVKAYLALSHPPDWSGIDGLPGMRWAAPAPTSLTNCLPDGNCYTRQGTATVGGRPMTAIAAGARTMVITLYLRNAAAPLGEEAVLAALRQAELTAELARCPVSGGAGTTRWYKLKGSGSTAGVISIQTVRGPRPSEGFVLTAGDQLPQLQPNQVSMYTEQCTPGAVAAAPPASAQSAFATGVPIQRLADVVVAYLLPANSATLEWRALMGLATGVTWDPAGPKPASLIYRNDPNPQMQTGSAIYGGRRFRVEASGTATQVKNIYLDEDGRHPRGEHMLGVVYTKGIAVRLVRCGPIYSESTNNWYSLNSPRTRPAMIRQSLSWQGTNVNSVSDTYELRLDGTLPTRDPRDRDPGVSGCQ